MSHDILYDAWSISTRESRLYTECREFRDVIQAATGVKPALYLERSRVYAWQFQLPTKLIPLLVGKFLKTDRLKFNKLRIPQTVNLSQDDAESLDWQSGSASANPSGRRNWDVQGISLPNGAA
jgi:hypothetical protein